MRLQKYTRQNGDALVAAIIAVLLFHLAGFVMMSYARNVKERRYFEAEGMGVLHMQRALSQYARANKASFKTGKVVMFVNNQYAPTVTELASLGFLSYSGPEVTAPWGRTFATTLTLTPTGGVEGAVYLTGNVTDQSGNADRVHACKVAKALGRIGICTPPSNATVLGNLTTQIPNPSGAPAAVGALVSIAP